MSAEFDGIWETLAVSKSRCPCSSVLCPRLLFNPIERSWAYLTQCLVSVELEVEIEENNYETPDTNEKWDIVLDKAVLDCGRFWHGKTLDRFPITVYPFLSSDPQIPDIKNTHEDLKMFRDASQKRLKEKKWADLRSEYIFYVRHLRRKKYQLEFIRCKTCQHCKKLPKRENQLLQVIDKFGGSLPSPVPSAIPNHYKSLDDMLRLNSVNQTYLPSSDWAPFGSCPYKGCHYAFFSQGDINRHFRLMAHNVKFRPKFQQQKRTKRRAEKNNIININLVDINT